MGFKTWRIFSGSSSETRRSRDSFTDERRTFLYFSIYAQGLPLLVCIATAITDACRERKHNGNGLIATRHFPNMGVVRCFVGEMYAERTTYLGSAKFLFNDMFMVANVITPNIVNTGQKIYQLKETIRIVGIEATNSLKILLRGT